MTHCGSKAWNYPLSRKCASHFFSPIAKTFGWSNWWFRISLPPIFSFLGLSFPHPPYLSFSLALVQRGLETEGVPKNQVDCSRLSFLRKTSMCWKEKVCCPRCRHKLGYEPKIMAPECFLVSLYFSSERLQGWGERVSCFSCLSRLCISVPWKQTKEKNGKSCSAGEDFNQNICFVHLGDQVELSRQYEHELRHWPYEQKAEFMARTKTYLINDVCQEVTKFQLHLFFNQILQYLSCRASNLKNNKGKLRIFARSTFLHLKNQGGLSLCPPSFPAGDLWGLSSVSWPSLVSGVTQKFTFAYLHNQAVVFVPSFGLAELINLGLCAPWYYSRSSRLERESLGRFCLKIRLFLQLITRNINSSLLRSIGSSVI